MITEKEEKAEPLLVLALAVLLFIGNSIVNGIVVACLWGWFVTPATGLQPIGIAEAIGLAAMMDWMTKELATRVDINKDAKKNVTMWTPLVQAGSMLLFGWIVHLFV